MKLILTDAVMEVSPDGMLFTKKRLTEILEFIDNGNKLDRVAEQRNEAVESIREACPDDRHMASEQFLNYPYCP